MGINENSQSVENYFEQRAREIFKETWNTLAKKHGSRRLKFPAKIVCLHGAPGSGKGTHSINVMRVLEISAKPIEVSSLLTSPQAQEIKAKGGLVDDGTVVMAVFDELLRHENASGVVIDGFPRTQVQALCLKMLARRLQTDDANRWCSVKIVNFEVSRNTSVDRQLARGRLAMNSGELARETDLSRTAAERRYQTYLDKTNQYMQTLKEMLEYHEINSEGSFEDVANRISNEFN